MDIDAYLRNASERILLDEVTVKGDSVSIEIACFRCDDQGADKWRCASKVNSSRILKSDYRLPFQS